MISTSKQCWTHLFAGRNTHHECLDRDRTCFNNSMCGPKMLECKFAEKVGSYKLALQFFLFVHKVVLFLNMYMFMPCNELFFQLLQSSGFLGLSIFLSVYLCPFCFPALSLTLSLPIFPFLSINFKCYSICLFFLSFLSFCHFVYLRLFL